MSARHLFLPSRENEWKYEGFCRKNENFKKADKLLQNYYKSIKNALQCDKNIYKREVLLYKYSN